MIGLWSGDDETVADSVGSNDGYALPPIGTVGSETSDTALLTVAASAAVITQFSVADGMFQAQVTGANGRSYIVQKTISLTAPNWTPVVANTVPFSFSDAVGNGTSFYRAIAE